MIQSNYHLEIKMLLVMNLLILLKKQSKSNSQIQLQYGDLLAEDLILKEFVKINNVLLVKERNQMRNLKT